MNVDLYCTDIPLDPMHAGKLCLTAADVVSSSKAIRAEIKSRVMSVQASKTEAHKKITEAVSKNMQEARAKKVNVCT